MYYYDTLGNSKCMTTAAKRDGSMVVYDDFDAPVSSINTLVPDFATAVVAICPTKEEQLLVI